MELAWFKKKNCQRALRKDENTVTYTLIPHTQRPHILERKKKENVMQASSRICVLLHSAIVVALKHALIKDHSFYIAKNQDRVI